MTYQLRPTGAGLGATVLRIYSVASGKLLHSWSTDQDIGAGTFGFAAYAQNNNQVSWVGGESALSFLASTANGR